MSSTKTDLSRFGKIQTEMEEWTHMCEDCGSPMERAAPVDDDGLRISTNLPFRYCKICDKFRLFMDEDPRVL